MAEQPTLVFMPGAWHKPSCYVKTIEILQARHDLKCMQILLPSTTANPESTFKDDVDAARKLIQAEIASGNDVVIISHSYGGMVHNSVIKGLAKPDGNMGASRKPLPTTEDAKPAPSEVLNKGHVIGLVLIASGFAFTGLAFRDPFLGRPPPHIPFDSLRASSL